ncbi:hypothetical protein [Poseidonibacter ostreae]|uniref:Uncharacterized protein n=1 Tax=Poseidonibacter ostreae TaxID=2654171 RepID=A0A6L4WWW6_9BACT|nr:hypothetical protein [Poseidonibacter ostreae]KAB7891349.1 hypothetical protein GBG19_00505 [Poseidonibacter ostreae]
MENVVVTLEACVMACYQNDDFVREFNRLNNTDIKKNTTPIDKAIDEATGKNKEELELFVEIVDKTVYRTFLSLKNKKGL